MTLNELIRQLRPYSDSPGIEARILWQETTDSYKLQQIIKRRKTGEPLSKILNKKGFWRGTFYVDKNVLDPRPDSEIMIQAILDEFPNKNQTYHILDIGTGSGCLLISLLMEYQRAIGTGIDISEPALKIAIKNAKRNNVQATFLQLDMKKITSKLGHFDFVISNPPYIPTQDIKTLDLNVQNFDPIIALDGGSDGLDYYRILAKLTNTDNIFVEIGIGQKNEVERIFSKQNWQLYKTYSDYGHIERILLFKKNL